MENRARVRVIAQVWVMVATPLIHGPGLGYGCHPLEYSHERKARQTAQHRPRTASFRLLDATPLLPPTQLQSCCPVRSAQSIVGPAQLRHPSGPPDG